MISDHNKQTNKPASKEKWNQAIKFPKCRLIRRWVDVICIVWPFFTRRFKNGKSIELALNSKRGINGQMNGIWRDIRFQWRRVIALLSYFDRNDEQRKRERERERSWKLNHDNNRNAKKCSMISTTSVSFFFSFFLFFFFFFKLFSYFGLRVLFCLSCLSLLLATAEPSGHFGVFGHGGGSGYGIGGFRRGVVLVAVAPERDPRRLAADHVAGCGGWGTGRLLLLLLLLVAVGDFEFLAVVARFPRRQHRIRAGDLARAP